MECYTFTDNSSYLTSSFQDSNPLEKQVKCIIRCTIQRSRKICNSNRETDFRKCGKKRKKNWHATHPEKIPHI